MSGYSLVSIVLFVDWSSPFGSYYCRVEVGGAGGVWRSNMGNFLVECRKICICCGGAKRSERESRWCRRLVVLAHWNITSVCSFVAL